MQAEAFHGLYCSGSMCVGVTLWIGCGGVVSVCRLQPAVHHQECSTAHTAIVYVVLNVRKWVQLLVYIRVYCS